MEFGGILFSPPKKDMVRKYHLCISCYKAILKDFKSKKAK